MTILWENVRPILERSLVVVSWAFWIGLAGYIGGSYISHFWEISFAILGVILGSLWGMRSSWLIC